MGVIHRWLARAGCQSAIGAFSLNTAIWRTCPFYVHTLTCKYVSRDFEFDWDDANRSHLAAHDITPAEFEEVYSGEKLETINERKGETRAAAVGKTKAGRLLTIVYTMRHGKARPVTAHMIPRRKRKLYEEKLKIESG